jgi:hypothetical protein
MRSLGCEGVFVETIEVFLLCVCSATEQIVMKRLPAGTLVP